MHPPIHGGIMFSGCPFVCAYVHLCFCACVYLRVQTKAFQTGFRQLVLFSSFLFFLFLVLCGKGIHFLAPVKGFFEMFLRELTSIL